MNGPMSDWELRKVRDDKIQNAINEARQDRLAQAGRSPDRAQSGRWLVTALLSGLLAIGFWLLHG